LIPKHYLATTEADSRFPSLPGGTTDELANSKRLSTHISVVRLSKGRGMDFMAEYEQCTEDVRKDYMGKLHSFICPTHITSGLSL